MADILWAGLFQIYSKVISEFLERMLLNSHALAKVCFEILVGTTFELALQMWKDD